MLVLPRGSLYFQGVNPTTTVTCDSAYQPTGNWSMACLIKPYSTGATASRIIDNAAFSSTGFQLGLNAWTGAATAAFAGKGGTTAQMASNRIIAGEWQWLGCAYTGSKMNFYLNGLLTDSITFSTNPTNGGHPLCLGNTSTGVRPFKGNIAYVGVWSRALAATEFYNLFKLGQVPYSPKGFWILDSSAGGTFEAFDLSGNSHHGAMTGGIWTTELPPPIKNIRTRNSRYDLR